ncbi:interleukin-10 receptor subunit alpha [Antennarius striatus]|uniref:interleukin-10 receptor subunit alpha n=1 Tax=Antennarius striatus TaxID=241820 RepID=UPI0035AF400D
MDKRNQKLFLVILIIYMDSVSAVMPVPKPENLVVDILDGEVMVLWKHPLNAPFANYQYNVQFAKYTGDWTMVQSCTGIALTSCNLSTLIEDYGTSYRVKVQLVIGYNKSAWAMKKVLPNHTELRPPIFNLWATSSTITVYVHQKTILKKLFPYGVIYTIYLLETGQDRKNFTEYLKDDAMEDQRNKTFSSLHWGREYCVRVKVDGIGTLSASSVSTEQCLRLPKQEWFIATVASLASLGVVTILTITAIILLCYLRRPEKTPAALESLSNGWFPLIVGDSLPEVVTDKCWFLSSHSTEKRNNVKITVIHAVTDGNGEDKGTSLDSGVSMECNSITNSSESRPWRQEDSGCGSLEGSESSNISQTDYPLGEKSTDRDVANKTRDSAVDLCRHLHSFSLNLNRQSNESPMEAVVLGNYRTQSPSAAQVQVCDNKEDFKQRIPESILAKVVTSYRAEPRWCFCSGAGHCRCCQQGLHGSGVIKHYRAMDNGNELQRSKCNSDFDKKMTISIHSKQTQMDTAFKQHEQDFPHLSLLTKLPLVEGKQDFNMNNLCLSLCDVQLTND